MPCSSVNAWAASCSVLRGRGVLGPNAARNVAVNDDVKCLKCAYPHSPVMPSMTKMARGHRV